MVIGWPGLFVPLACLAACDTADQSATLSREKQGEDARAKVSSSDQQPTGQILTLTDRRLQWPVTTVIAGVAPIRYIEIVIDEIDNPRLIPLQFRLFAPDPSGGERLLGSFASYPANRPGRYLIQVPPQFRLGEDIILALVPATEVSTDDAVRVRIGAVRFLPAKGD